MRIVPYYNPAPSVVTGLCCVRLEEGTPPPSRESGAEVWLESFHPPAVIGEARRGGSVTLNSLWLDAALWNAYDGSFDMFDRIVLMPYDPNEPERAYEDNVKLLLECAARRGIPKSRLTVDLCILPYSRRRDVEVYAARAGRLAETGLATVAGLDNLVFREAGAKPLLERLIRLLDGSIEFGLISARYNKWAERLCGK